MLDLEFVRPRFPALSEDWALFDNAGGSVPLGSVVDAVADHMRRLGVQLGASYALSAEAEGRVADGHRAMETYVGAQPGEVVLGPSSTVLLNRLSRALRPLWREGDEVIVTNLDHEANIGGWRALETTGIRVKEWRFRPETAALELEDLKPLLTDRTRLVAMTHCSNLVGRIHDVAAVAEVVHGAGALLCVDGVAFAPHRRIDVGALRADFYVFSTYKTYGPHQAVLWGRRDLLLEARGQYHYFIPEDDVPYKLQPGGANHELASSLPAIVDYFERLAEHHGVGSGDGRARLQSAFDLVAGHEQRLAQRILDCLASKPHVTVVGPTTADRGVRVPTISFYVQGRRSSEIPPLVDAERVAIRWGHFYAARAVQALGLEEQDGLVRISAVHYNTFDEVERLVGCWMAFSSPKAAMPIPPDGTVDDCKSHRSIKTRSKRTAASSKQMRSGRRRACSSGIGSWRSEAWDFGRSPVMPMVVHGWS